MTTNDLKLIYPYISEDGYIFKGCFTLIYQDKIFEVDLDDFATKKLSEIKNYFSLDECEEEIETIVMNKFVDEMHRLEGIE